MRELTLYALPGSTTGSRRDYKNQTLTMKKMELEKMEPIHGGGPGMCGLGVGIGLAMGGPAGFFIALGLCSLSTEF